ncbi:MAG: hypothetical protein U9R72_13635 [Chloroflexota bacterium]|nr:hypothetical protein [Chloroflexota bacterium]
MFYPSDPVLVGVMNSRRDFALARDEGWYRIPEERAPESATEAVVLAFYFTKAFGDEKWAVHYYAPVEGHELVRRRDLLPGEADHPRADDPYYKLQLGPVMKLDEPIPSLRWRRVTFIESTWDRFSAAEEINDLYASGADGLYVTLKDEKLHPEREFVLREDDAEYVVDMAIPCRQGTVCVALGDRPAPRDALRDPDPDEIREAVEALGGERPVC